MAAHPEQGAPRDHLAMGPRIGAGKLLRFRTPGPLGPRHLTIIPRTGLARAL